MRRLLRLVLQADQKGPQSFFELSEEAIERLKEEQEEGVLPISDEAGMDSFCTAKSKPFLVSFEEREMANELNISTDELHSVMVHLGNRAKGSIVLHSRFPTKLKLRFFGRSSADELAKQDPLLRRLLPLAKKHGPVHTIETAKVVALLGGAPSQLSRALMQAGGDDFSVEKAEYGYMLSIVQPVGEPQVQAWAEDIAQIGAQVRSLNIEKLDAAFVALSRAAEAGTERGNAMVKLGSGDAGLSKEKIELPPTSDQVLNELINSYFATRSSFSLVVGGSKEECGRVMRAALGNDYSAPGVAKRNGVVVAGAEEAKEVVDTTRQEVEAGAVYSVVLRLVLSSEWPNLPTDEPASVARVVAQFLAGFGSVMMPAKNWRTHRCWGRFRQVLAFERLEELVVSALEKHQTQKLERAAAVAAAAAAKAAPSADATAASAPSSATEGAATAGSVVIASAAASTAM